MGTDARIIAIGAAKRRVPGDDRLRIKVTADGGLELRLPGTPKYIVAADVARDLLDQLVADCRRARYRKLGLRPAAPLERVTRQGPGSCHRKRDGGLGVTGHGCRRRHGHPGACRDAGGNYTPAICSHIGQGRTTIWVPSPSGGHAGFLHCAHCNGEVGRVPPGTTCPL